MRSLPRSGIAERGGREVPHRCCAAVQDDILSLFLVGLCELHGARDSFAFFDEDDLIYFHIFQRVDLTAGPMDFENIDFFRFAQAKVNPQIVLGEVATAASDFVDLAVWF